MNESGGAPRKVPGVTLGVLGIAAVAMSPSVADLLVDREGALLTGSWWRPLTGHLQDVIGGLLGSLAQRLSIVSGHLGGGDNMIAQLAACFVNATRPLKA